MPKAANFAMIVVCEMGVLALFAWVLIIMSINIPYIPYFDYIP